MTIESARDVRQTRSDEAAWFSAGALLIAAGLATNVSVSRQWSLCSIGGWSSPTCLTLKQTMNMLPIQADTLALRAPGAAGLAALGLTLTTLAWIVFLILSPLSRGIKIFGAVGAWFGVWSVESWVAHGGTWIIIGLIVEFVAIGFLVYATMSRQPVNRVTTQRLIVLLFGVTAFGTMHQSAEFILFGLPNQSATGVPRYLGFGTGLTLFLTGVGVIWMTLWARKKPPHAHDPSIMG
jgi:hypothetical protein